MDTAKEHLTHTGDSSTRKADLQPEQYAYRADRSALARLGVHKTADLVVYAIRKRLVSII